MLILNIAGVGLSLIVLTFWGDVTSFPPRPQEGGPSGRILRCPPGQVGLSGFYPSLLSRFGIISDKLCEQSVQPCA